MEPAVQGSEAWLLERLGLATASNFDKVMMGKSTAGRQQYMTELALERIYQRPTETFKSKAMERGTDLEPLARMEYVMATKNMVQEAHFVKHELLPAGASPDGYVGKDGLIEIKCPLAHNHLTALRYGKVPKVYIWQVYGQQLMTGRTWTDFVSYSDEFPANAALAIVRVERDDDMIQELEKELAIFLDEVEELVSFITNYKGKI